MPAAGGWSSKCRAGVSTTNTGRARRAFQADDGISSGRLRLDASGWRRLRPIGLGSPMRGWRCAAVARSRPELVERPATSAWWEPIRTSNRNRVPPPSTLNRSRGESPHASQQSPPTDPHRRVHPGPCRPSRSPRPHAVNRPVPAHRARLLAELAAGPVWSSLQTAWLGRMPYPPQHGARQYPGPADSGCVEQREHDHRDWRWLTGIQHRGVQQRTVGQTFDRDTPGLERRSPAPPVAFYMWMR